MTCCNYLKDADVNIGHKMKFCPFCGKEQDPRFKICYLGIYTSLNWQVSDRGKLIALFCEEKDATDHVRHLMENI